MTATQKIIWSLGLVCAFLLILITGQTNVRNFQNIQSSIEEIYKDRLVVKGIIFELSSLIHKKEIANLTNDKNFYSLRNDSVNAQIEEQIRAFKETKLTSYEETTLNRFVEVYQKLKANETEFGLSAKDEKLQPQIKTLQEDLKTLSQIQIKEGKKKLNLSDEAVKSMNTFAAAENYILVIFAVLMLVIIFVVPNKKKESI